MRRVADAVLALSSSPMGFTASDMAEKVRAMSGEPDSEYGARRAAYDIKKLRGKGMVRKIGASRRYETLHEGLRALTALVVLRAKADPATTRCQHSTRAPLQTIQSDADRSALRKPPRRHAWSFY